MSVKAVRVKDIMGVMEEIAPKKLAENWDKPGLAIGDPEREVKKILVALDVIDPVVEEAKRVGADMGASPFYRHKPPPCQNKYPCNIRPRRDHAAASLCPAHGVCLPLPRRGPRQTKEMP